MTDAPTPAEDDPLFAAALELWLETEDEGRVRSTYPELADEVLKLADARGALDRLIEVSDPPAAAAMRVPGYAVERQIGQGGQGAVFLARQTALARTVALKVLWRRTGVDAAARERFAREARAAAALRHPSVVAVYDAGEAHRVAWIAMEFVAGGSLGDAFAARRDGPPTALLPAGAAARAVALAPAFAALADGLAAAHAAGVVHRDVKPSNVLLGVDGELKLADFGLAAMSGAADRPTLSGRPLGTLGYMSPEQARGDRRAIGPRSDVYGLGAVLFEAASLHPAFADGSEGELLAKIAAGKVAEPRPPDGRLPAAFAAILRRALETDPELRYATAAEFASDLRAFAAGLPVAAERRRPAARAWSALKRRPAATAAALVCVAALGGLAASESRRVEQAARLSDAATRARRHERDRLAELLRADFLAALRAGLGGANGLTALRATADRIGAEFADDRALLARAASLLTIAGDPASAKRLFPLHPGVMRSADVQLAAATTVQTPEHVLKIVAEAEREGPFDAYRNYLAGRALALADPARAETYLRAARTAADGDPAYVVEIGRIMADLAFRRGDADDADEWLVAAYKESKLTSLLAARLPVLKRLGRDADARRILAELRRELPRAIDAEQWRNAILAIAEFGDPVAAFELAGKEPGAFGPVIWADLRLRAAAATLAGADLAAEVERILDLVPPDVRILRTGVSTLTSAGRFDLAEKRFEAVRRLDPDSANTRLDAAMWAALRGDEADAWANFVYVERAGLGPAETDVARARVLTTLGDVESRVDPLRARPRFEQAAALLRKRVAEAPPLKNWAETLLAVEVLRLRDGAAGAATAASMMRARAAAEHEVQAILEDAVRAGAAEAALQAAEGALTVQPDAESLLELRVRTLVALERPDDALAASETFLKTLPRSVAATAIRAEVLDRIDEDAAGALALYRKLFAETPQTTQTRFASALNGYVRLADASDAPLLRARLSDFRRLYPLGAAAVAAALADRLRALGVDPDAAGA